MNQGVDSWGRSQMEDEEEDDDEEDEDIIYDDDEDEFGLPSITSMRKKQKQNVDPLPSRGVDPGGRIGGSASALSIGLGNSRQRANSSDIAEERGVPMYPTARKGEGKILRPQYKDILRGNGCDLSCRSLQVANRH